MKTAYQTPVEVIEVEPQGWCTECHSFATIYSVLLHVPGLPAEAVDLCRDCVDEAADTAFDF